MKPSFKSRPLRQFHEKGDASKLPPNLVERIEDILDRLETMTDIQDMNLPSLRLHRLKGGRKGQWSVDVNKNYRITFRFIDGRVEEVDLVDYH